AYADAAALLRARKLQIFAQELDEEAAVFHLGADGPAIEGELDASHAALVFSLKPSSTFSALTGNSTSLTPTASNTAFVIAAGTATLLISPIAVVENGARPPPPGSRTVSSSGMSMTVGSL